jgi:hypothetical protein
MGPLGSPNSQEASIRLYVSDQVVIRYLLHDILSAGLQANYWLYTNKDERINVHTYK